MEFGVLVFVEGGKPENPVKKPSEQGENQQQTQPTYGTGLESSRATVVGGERSHHCQCAAIPTRQIYNRDKITVEQ